MYKQSSPLFLICETPLHAGSGSDLGIVDLPIQRERHTSFPKIEASSLKGALRETLETNILDKNQGNMGDLISKIKDLNRVFGFDDGALKGLPKKEMKKLFNDKQKEFSGCIAFTDARLLLFPVKSLHGVFAWITCPRVINKFISDYKLQNKDLPFVFNEDKGLKTDRVPSSSRDLFDAENRIRLEEFIFSNIKPEDKDSNLDNFANWIAEKVFANHGQYWKNKAKTDIVILKDEDFRDFINISTEVITRTKIDNVTGTVQTGALFTEEYLPSESVMYAIAAYSDEFRKPKDDDEDDADLDTAPIMQVNAVQQFLKDGLQANNNVIQLGGNATLGKGIIRTVLL